MKRLMICLLAISALSGGYLLKAETQPDKMEAKQASIIPPKVRPGGRIALVTPASWIDSSVVNRAISRIEERGYQVVPMPHVYGREGGYAASLQERIADLHTAISDPEIDAILCTRGGYGCVHLLPELDAELIRQNPKWIIGFSDISALHAWLTRQGVASIHGPMTSHIGKEAADDACTQALFDIIEGQLPLSYEFPSSPFNNPGSASGLLTGGNVLVVNGLSETPYDVLQLGNDQDVILFFEDIGEKIYAIERVLMRLHQSGALKNARGLIFGQFTDYSPDMDFESMEHMISYWLRQWGYYDSSMPIVFDFPAGHVSINYPLIFGAEADLDVSPEAVRLVMGK